MPRIMGNPWSGPGWRPTQRYRQYVSTGRRNDALMRKFGRLDPRTAQMMRSGGRMPAGGQREPSLRERFEQEEAAANEANEQRYQDILGGYRDRYSQSMDLMQGLGERERSDINRQYNEAGEAQHQDLVNRGLSASTVGTPQQRQIALGRADALGGLDERLRLGQLNLHGAQSGDALQFMERRTDEGPDVAQMIALYKEAGLGGVGGRGGGGLPRAFNAGIQRGGSVSNQYAAAMRGGLPNQYAAAMQGLFNMQPRPRARPRQAPHDQQFMNRWLQGAVRRQRQRQQGA